MPQFRIPEENLETLVNKIIALNKTAERLGAPPIHFKGVGEEWEGEGAQVTRVYILEITGESPRIHGWQFIAKLDHEHAGGPGINILRVLPGEMIDEKYRTAEPICDHCGLIRDRKMTYVLRHEDGREVQVGSSCLRDFLGHENPEQLAAWFETALSVTDRFREFEERGVRASPYIWKRTYLACVRAAIRHYGWRSRSKAQEEGGTSTADVAWAILVNHQRLLDDKQPTEEDYTEADKAIQWVEEELSNQPDLGDYEWNLVAALKSDGELHISNTGIAASVFVAYQRAHPVPTPQQAASVFVGTVGEKLCLTGVLCTLVRPIDSRYGVTYLHRFVTAEGNSLTWFASSTELKEGKHYNLKGTVKAHEVYRGEKQTLLTRCKVEELEEE